MTGGRPGRDPRIAGRRERGPQRGEQTPPEARWTGTGGAELEELHVAAVTARGGMRIGMQTAIAGVALVVLLAVGFGAFGGRPQPSTLPIWSPVAIAPTPRLTEPKWPRITPFAPCAPETNALPTVLLEDGGNTFMGAIEVLGVNPDALPPDIPEPGTPPRVPIGSGDLTAIVIDGARCALAWVIDYDATTTIDVVSNGAMDPTRSAQNRFELALADNPGRDSLLRAQLLFPGFSVRASWHVKVARPEHPTAKVEWLDGDTQAAVEGCFVVFQFETGWREPDHDCSVSAPPPDPKAVQGYSEFRFFLEGWSVSIGGVNCGHGVNDTYVPDRDGCPSSYDEANRVIGVQFPKSLAKGVWTLAIESCADDGPVPAQLCGVWYTAVEVT